MYPNYESAYYVALFWLLGRSARHAIAFSGSPNCLDTGKGLVSSREPRSSCVAKSIRQLRETPSSGTKSVRELMEGGRLVKTRE